MGATITYTLRVTNPNSVTLEDILVVDELNDNYVRFVLGSVRLHGAATNYTFTNGRLEVNVTPLASGETNITFDVVVLPAAAGRHILNTAQLYGPVRTDGTRELLDEDDWEIEILATTPPSTYVPIDTSPLLTIPGTTIAIDTSPLLTIPPTSIPIDTSPLITVPTEPRPEPSTAPSGTTAPPVGTMPTGTNGTGGSTVTTNPTTTLPQLGTISSNLALMGVVVVNSGAFLAVARIKKQREK